VRVSASNCSDAFTMPTVSAASFFSAPRCVVASVTTWRRVSALSVAAASAAPSAGSVPLPISSSSTRLVGPARSRMSRTAATWAEAVHLHGVTGASAEVVEGDTHLPGRGEPLAVRPQQVGQLAQHPLHLPLLGSLQIAQLVAELDDLGRLDEHRRPARRRVVHD